MEKLKEENMKKIAELEEKMNSMVEKKFEMERNKEKQDEAVLKRHAHYQYYPDEWEKGYKVMNLEAKEEEVMSRKMKELQLKADIDALGKMEDFKVGMDPDVFLDKIFRAMKETYYRQRNQTIARAQNMFQRLS